MPKGKYPRKPKLRAVVSNPYTLVLTMAGTKFETSGESIEVALTAIPLEWQQVKAKATLDISNGEKKYQHLFFMKDLRRILVNKVTRMMWGKRLELLLKEKGI